MEENEVHRVEVDQASQMLSVLSVAHVAIMQRTII